MGIADVLRAREPIFHRREVVGSVEDVDREMSDDYSRDVVLATLAERLEADQDEYETEGWRLTEFGVREIAAATYLVTYVLHQPDRVTRRLTVWQGSEETGWQALYHQGTVVT
jgi:hypothetical protein